MTAQILTLPVDTTMASVNMACGCGQCNQTIDITLVHTRRDKFVVSVIVHDPDVNPDSPYMPVILTCANIDIATQRYNRQVAWHIDQGAVVLGELKPVLQ